VKPFQNQLENKIGVVTYDADEHLKVQIKPPFNVLSCDKNTVACHTDSEVYSKL